MNHLLAKVRGQGRGPNFRKIISGNTLFDLPDNLTAHIDYSPDHNLDEDSWFGIEDFSEKPYSLPFLRQRFNSAEYDQLPTTDIERVDFICSYQNRNEYYFQKVTKSQLISKKMLYIGDAYSFYEGSKIIVINNYPDAIYIKDRDILYFKKLSTITSIFRGIDALYREATEAETNVFLQNDFIHLDNGFCTANVGKANRRRIAMAVDTMSTFLDEEKTELISYIHDYCHELQFLNNSFVIRTDNDLKLVIYGIEQRYYTTQLKGEKRLANSVIVLD